MAHKEVEGTPLATILHEALFVVYRDMVVSRLRQVLSADDVASASPVEAREKQIEAHESVAPVRDVFSVVDLNAANHLLNVFAHRLLPAAKGRAAQEVAVAEFRRDIRQVRVWRDPVAHTTETNRPEGKDAIRAIEAAQRVLRQLGLDADALNRFVWRIRSTDEAARRAIDAATRYALPPRARLFGRVDDLRSFVSRLETTDSNLLTVTGAGGAGKTSLAIEAVRELARRKGLHALFVTVESATSEQQVLDQIGGAIGLHGSSDLEGQVVEKLQTNPTVVLIDNFEQALSATTLVDRIAQRCERSVFVVTSRERLAVRREVTLELSTLIVPHDDDSIGDIKVNPAVAMFLSRLDAGGGNRVLSDDEYRDIAEIVRRVDGLCLAIELLAAQCVDRNIREVKADIPRLMSISSSDVSAPERHRTLNACLMISWRRSSEREQALLKRISILFGEFSQSAVDEMCFDLRLGTPSDLTSSAHRRSLLRKTAEGYSFLDPVRQFIAAQASRDEQRKGMAALLRYAKKLADVVSTTDQPELVPLIKAFRIGSNALAMLELVHTIVDRDNALTFLLSWCPLSWRFDQSFGRWDDELIAMLYAFTRRRRRDISDTVAAGLVELARLLNHHDRAAEARPAARAALLQAVALDNAPLASRSGAALVEATTGQLPARRAALREVRRLSRNKAWLNAMWSFAGPALPEENGHPARDDVDLAISALHAIADGQIRTDGIGDAGATLFHANLLFDVYGAPTRLWSEHVRLAKASRDRFTIHEVLFTYACDRLKLSEDLWDAAVIEAIGSPGSLVIETADFGAQPFDVLWPAGHNRRVLTDLLRAAHRARPTVRSTALLVAISIRGGDDAVLSSNLRQLSRDPLDSGSDARVIAAIATWCGRSGHGREAVGLLAPLVAWLALNRNELAAFALASRLSGMGVAKPSRRWRLTASEKEAARRRVDDWSIVGLAEYAENEVLRVNRRSEAKSRADLGLRGPDHGSDEAR